MKKALILLFALVGASVADAKVVLPQLFQSGMVMQRGKSIPVWGQADAGETVSVTFKKKTYTTTAGADGSWRVLAPTPSAIRGGARNAVAVPGQGSAD